jgi:RHS repeat-associated protein
MAESFCASALVHRFVRSASVLVLSLCAFAGHARAQSVAVDGDHFTVDGEARFLTFLSYFDAMRATDIAGDFAFIRQQAAFDGVRIFANWWIYTGTPATCPQPGTDTLFDDQGRIRGDNGDVLAPSSRLLRLIEVLRAAQTQGLIVDLTFTRENVGGDLTVDEYTTAIRRTAVLLREYRNVIFDIQNERDNGTSSQLLNYDQTRVIKEAIKAVDPARVVIASTSGGTPAAASGAVDNPAGARGFNIRAEMDAIAYHDPRGAGWETRTTTVVQTLRTMSPFPLKPVYLQEPTRWRIGTTTACGTAETDSSDPVAANFRTALQNAKVAGAAAWTFHTQRAFRLAGQDPLHKQILDRAPGDAERELYVGAGPAKLAATPGTWLVRVPLTVRVTGPGSVGGDVTCPSEGTCTISVVPGTVVNLTTQVDTVPNARPRFEGWDMLPVGTPCAGTPACQVIVRAPTDIGARFGFEPLPKTEFYHTDALGSIRAVTEIGSSAVTRTDFLPFGERIPMGTLDPVVTQRLFTGKERDAETGLDYFGARYYASQTGRFTTVDPVLDVDKAVTNPQLWNRYAYTTNNPLRRVDPDGRQELDANLAKMLELLKTPTRALAGRVKAPLIQVIYEETIGWALGETFGYNPRAIPQPGMMAHEVAQMRQVSSYEKGALILGVGEPNAPAIDGVDLTNAVGISLKSASTADAVGRSAEKALDQVQKAGFYRVRVYIDARDIASWQFSHDKLQKIVGDRITKIVVFAKDDAVLVFEPKP